MSFAASKTGPHVGSAAKRVPDRRTPPSGPVSPGGSSSALLGMFPSAQIPACQLTRVAGLRIYPPDQTVPIYVAYPSPQMQCVNSLTIAPLVAGVPNYQ